jgi:hypothetical protein
MKDLLLALSESFELIRTRHFIIYCEVLNYTILLCYTEGNLSDIIRIHFKLTRR